VFAFLALGIICFLKRKSFSKFQKFLAAWFFIILLPVSQIVPVRAHINAAAISEHFMYLPSIGVFALIVMYTDRLFDLKEHDLVFTKGMLEKMIICSIGIMLAVTLQHNFNNQNEINMLARSLRYETRNSRLRTSYALALAKVGKYSSSEEQFKRVLQKDPGNVKARIALGKSLIDQGKYEQGIVEYESIQKPEQYSGLLTNNLEAAYKLLIKQYKERLVFDVQNYELYHSLGIIYTKTGQTKKAIEEFKKTIALKPDHKSARFNLAVGYESIGEKGPAVIQYETLINLEGEKDTRDKIAYERLYELYLGFKDFIKADKYMKLRDQGLRTKGKY